MEKNPKSLMWHTSLHYSVSLPVSASTTVPQPHLPFSSGHTNLCPASEPCCPATSFAQVSTSPFQKGLATRPKAGTLLCHSLLSLISFTIYIYLLFACLLCPTPSPLNFKLHEDRDKIGFAHHCIPSSGVWHRVCDRKYGKWTKKRAKAHSFKQRDK